MTLYDDHYARWSYEQLLLQQPHLAFGGLWRKGNQHFILCKDAATATTAEGEDLRLWFDHKCRVMTAWAHIVETCPDGAERVPERGSAERAWLAGAPRTRRDVLVDLGLALPADFPPFTVENPGADVIVVTSRALSAGETQQVQTAWAALGYAKPVQFAVDPSSDPVNEPFRFRFGDGDIDLIPSRRLGRQYSRALRYLVEDDEQAWADKKERLFASDSAEREEILSDFRADSSILGCLVDATVFVPDNIRAHLSLYDKVYLALPIAESFSANCEALGVTEVELRELVELGRVHLVLPQSIDRYPLDWLNAVAESAPQNILLSRRLAAATVCDARRRIPILYPPLSPIDRHATLHVLASNASDLVGAARAPQLIRFLTELGTTWSGAEWAVHSRGAMGTSHFGIGAISSVIYQQVTGKDLSLELWSAAQKVEWAAALGAHVFPSSSGDYDESKACDLVAGVYGGRATTASVSPRTALSAVADLLAINSSVRVVDFAREFASSDIQRLRALVLSLTRQNVDPECLRDAIQAFNAEVRHYEKRPDLLKNLNVVGLFSAGASAAKLVDPAVSHMVPLAGALLGFVINRMLDELPRHSSVGGRVIDFCNSLLTVRANPDAVLVARARKDIARLKE